MRSVWRHLLTCGVVLCGLIPVSGEEVATEKTDAADVTAALRPFIDRGELAGAEVLVANRDGILEHAAIGFSDLAAGQKMETGQLYWIASMTKAMTAAAFLMLVEEGKIGLDDPIETLLPEFQDQQVVEESSPERTVLRKRARSITPRMLLSHTSGLPFASRIEQPTFDILPLRNRVLSYAAEPLLTDPGTRFHYSNEGFNVAGRLIEVISGQSYEEFLRERLLGPLGMVSTVFRPSKQALERLAKTYRPGDGGLREIPVPQLQAPLDGADRQPMPGGGLFSTAEDVSRFCRLLLGEGEFEGKRLLSAESVRLMMSRQTPESVDASYGLGLSVGPDRAGHGGALNTDMSVFPSRNLVLVFLIQQDGFAGEGAGAMRAFQEAALERQAAGAETKN